MVSTLGNFIIITFFLSFCAVIISAERTNEEDISTNFRNKRSFSSLGLFPFPRVGRSQHFPITWGILAGDDKFKREGLIPFPRVGRSGPKRNGGGGNGGGLWFGPRLGRSQKRGDSWTLEQLQPGFLPGYPNYNQEESENKYTDEPSDKVLSSKIE